MVATASAVLIALFALGVGIVIGALLWRSLGPHQHRNRDLENRLAQAERRLGEYQTEVTEHFVETSRRVNELTRNYKEVHDYLASSATKLSNPTVGRELEAAARISWAEAGDQNSDAGETTQGEMLEQRSERSDHRTEDSSARSVGDLKPH